MNKEAFKKKVTDFVKKYNLKSVKDVVAKQKELGQKGFTLLELLVVVAILAAIAGTATIALKDTDARASAAAHVAMMDELNKGIRTYRVLKRNELPSRFDSLMVSPAPYASGTAAGSTGSVATLGFDIAGGDAVTAALTDGVQGIMAAGGIAELMYIDETAMPPDAVANTYDCQNGNIRALVGARSNAVVAGNIFMSAAANGCGTAVPMDANGDAHMAVFWNGGSERLTGQVDLAGAGSAYNAVNNYAYLITGIGPSSNLFDANELGGMTTVPVYRHVKPVEYNRFMAVWNVGTYIAAGAILEGDQCELVAIVDGALDTKEEELGEWDGTRNTI